MRSGFESSDFLLSLCSVKSQRYAEKLLCPVVSPVSVCGGGPVPRRRILSLCRTRGAARTAHDRFDDLLPRRAVPFGPLRPSHRFQPAAGRAPAPRTGLHPGTHVAHGRCGFLPLPRGAAPARGRRTALCGLAAAPGEPAAAGGMRAFRFSDGEPLQPFLASVRFTDRNYLVGAKAAVSASPGDGWRISAALDARSGRDMHVEGSSPMP